MPDNSTATLEKVHDLKCWVGFFQDVLDERKPFEVREDDRNYKVGDVLHLREWSPDDKVYTGRDCRRTVSYITSYGQSQGYVVMGLARSENTLHPTIRDIDFDANVERLKACEHIANGDEGWERLRNECPSTAAVAALRDTLAVSATRVGDEDERNIVWMFRYDDGSWWTDDVFEQKEHGERFATGNDADLVEGASLVRVLIVPTDRTAGGG